MSKSLIFSNLCKSLDSPLLGSVPFKYSLESRLNLLLNTFQMRRLRYISIVLCSMSISLLYYFQFIQFPRNTRLKKLNLTKSTPHPHLSLNTSSSLTQPECTPNTLNPPKLSLEELKVLAHQTLLQKSPNEILTTLSSIVQQQILNLNSPSNCSARETLLCGHFDSKCGFACQFHHRAACLMISYAMNLSLIHDQNQQFWSYSHKWDDVLQPLGSSCTPTNLMYIWSWNHTTEWYFRDKTPPILGMKPNVKWNPCNKSNPEYLDYPLTNGIVVDPPTETTVEQLTSNSKMWWIGQFIGHGFVLNQKTHRRIQMDKDSLGLTSNCIGIHIRRTDKVKETVNSFHNLREYFREVYKLTGARANTSGHVPPQIYLATDDAIVFQHAKRQYLDMEIQGFPMESGKPREETLFEIVRDIYLLNSCKHVICGLTSNVCRLLLELRSFSDHKNMFSNFTSLDGDYSYVLTQHGLQM